MNFKEELAKLKQGINVVLMNDDDIADAIDFVAELMDLMRIHTEQKHPHATRSIRDIKESYNQVRNLEEWMKDVDNE